jgi:tetratricopeptide (TPR) repeat protein
MPLLKQLDEFRSSFLQVANEAQRLSASQTIPVKLELPVNDPPTPYPPELDGGEIVPEPGELNIDELDLGSDGADFPDVSFDTPAEPAAPSPPPAPPSRAAPPSAPPPSAAPLDMPPPETEDDFGPIGDVLGDTLGDALADMDGGDIDLSGDLGGGDFGGGDFGGSDLGGGNLGGGDFGGGDFGGGDLGGGDLGGGDFGAGDGSFNLDDLGIPDGPDIPMDTTPMETTLADTGDSTGFGDLNLEGISGLTHPTDAAATAAADSAEMPSLEEGIDLSESLDLGGEAPGSGFGVPLEDISGTALGPKGASDGMPSIDDFSMAGFGPSDAASTSPDDSFDVAGFDAPPSDLGDSMDLGGETFDISPPETQGADSGGFDISGLDMSGFGDTAGSGEADTPSFDIPDTGIEGFGGAEDASPFDAGGFDAAGFGDADSSDLGGFDAGAFDGGAGDGSASDGGASDLASMDDINPFGSSDSSDVSFDGAEDMGGFDAGGFDAGAFDGGMGDSAASDDGVSDLASMDDINPFGSSDSSDISFDGTAGDAMPSMPEPELDTPDFSAPPEDDISDTLNDFSLPGIDDIPDPADIIAKSKAKYTAKSGIPDSSRAAAKDDVEEINLSDSEYKQLLETLSVYPLNLRVACEEIIAEHAVAPEQMSALVRLLVRGAPARETAILAGKILGRIITIPKGYTKQTGAEMQEEQGSFSYIFVHRFLPVLRLFAGIAIVGLSVAYLCWNFIVVPIQAENLYKEGYTQLRSGEYTRSNDLFRMAFEKHRVKNWFYRYAEGFRDERQYIFAERKYDELLHIYPRDKKGALDYAAMETYYLRNFEKADRIIRANILDYSINDKEGLLALAENSLEWGESDPSRYEEARSSYSRLIEIYGRKDPYLEGMLKYFIRTDKLNEVLPLQAHFMSKKKRKITVPTLTELGAYLLDKRFEEKGGVPEEYAGRIEGIRDILLRAITEDSFYPESYYHLARYYRYYSLFPEERQTLKDAIKAFSIAGNETPKRAAFYIDAHRRLAEALIRTKEFFPAEEEAIKGIKLYEDARARQVVKTDSMFGQLYAIMGDLEYFIKDGNMEAALRYYKEAEQNLWSPQEIQYRMGAAHYQLEQWDDALQRLFMLSPAMPNNRRLLYALGNVSFMRGNYFAAQGYYNRLLDILDMERVRFPNLTPDSRPEEKELTERIMVVENNLGVTLEALTRVSGDTSYRSRALGLFANSIRAWDVLTRDPDTMNRMRPFKDLYGPGVNLAYLNVRAITLSEPNYDPQIFMRIDRDCVEPSAWEDLIPRDYQLSDQLLSATGE